MSDIKSQFKPSDETLREAEAKFKQGKFAEAEPLFLLALVLLERGLPEDHPEVLGCMEKLGDTFYASEKFKDAAPVYKRLVGIREKSLGSHQLTISGLFKLAKTCERLAQVEEAEANYMRAADLGESIPGPLYANLLDAYAGLLKRTGRDAEKAAQLEARAKERRQRDATAATQRANIAAQSSTLEQAAVVQPDNGERLTSAAAPVAPPKDTSPRTSTSSAPAAKASEPSDEHFDAIEAASEKAPQQSISDALASRPSPATFMRESETSKFDAIKFQGNMPPPKPAASSPLSKKSSEVDSIKPPGGEAEAQPSPASLSKSDLDAIKAPGETKAPSAFDKSALDSIKGAGDGKAPSQFDKSALDSIRGPGGESKAPSAFDKGALDSIKGPSEKPAASYSKQDLDAIKPPAAKPPGSFSRQELDALKSPGVAFDKSVLDSIKAPEVSEAPVARGTPGGAGLGSRMRATESAPGEGEEQTGPGGVPWKSGGSTKGSRAGISKIRGSMPLIDAQAIAAIVIIVLFLGAVGWMIYNNAAHPTKRSNQEITDYVNKTFKTADDTQWLTLSDVFHGHLYLKKKNKPERQKFDVDIDVYNGGFGDQLSVITGQYEPETWMLVSSDGLKGQDTGVMFYSPDAVDAAIVHQMWTVADAAQAFYNKHGRYPRQPAKDPFHMRDLSKGLSFVNPVSKSDMPPELVMIDLPANEMPKLSDRTELEKKWMKGDPFKDGIRPGGMIKCAQLGWPKLGNDLIEDNKKYGTQAYDCFYIEGYDSNGKIIRNANGNVFLIVLKKGVDYTEPSAPPLVSKTPTTLVLSMPGDRPTGLGIIIKYLSTFAILAIVVVLFLKKDAIRTWLRRGQ